MKRRANLLTVDNLRHVVRKATKRTGVMMDGWVSATVLSVGESVSQEDGGEVGDGMGCGCG